MRKVLEAVLAVAILVIGGSAAAVLTGALPAGLEVHARQVTAALGLDALVQADGAAVDPADRRRGGGGRDGGRGTRWGGTAITAQPVALVPFVDRIQAVGTGRATKSVIVASSVAGLVETVHFSSTQAVAAGDPLVTLERDAEGIALEGARAQYSQAKAANDRYQQAGQRSGTFSTAQIEEVATALSVAEAALKQAQFEFDRRVIRAPFAGRVGLDDLAAGQHLAAGAEVVRLDDTSALEVEFLVPETRASDARPGTPVRSMSLALPGRVFEGEIAATDSHIDAATRTLRVRAVIPNQDEVLTPGMTFSISVRVEGETMPVVPALAIQWSRQGAFVWRVAGDGVDRVPVVIGKREGDAVYVRAALAEGDLVAVEGAQKLNEGSTVKIHEAPAVGEALTVEVPALRQPADVPVERASSAVQVTR